MKIRISCAWCKNYYHVGEGVSYRLCNRCDTVSNIVMVLFAVCGVVCVVVMINKYLGD